MRAKMMLLVRTSPLAPLLTGEGNWIPHQVRNDILGLAIYFLYK